MKNQPGDSCTEAFLRCGAQFSHPAKVRASADHSPGELHCTELKVSGVEQLCNRAAVRVIAFSLPGRRGCDVQTLQPHPIRSQRVRLDVALDFVVLPLAGYGAHKIPGSTQSGLRL